MRKVSGQRSQRVALQCTTGVAALIAVGLMIPTKAAAQGIAQPTAPAAPETTAQTISGSPPPSSNKVPEIVVTAPKPAARPHRNPGARTTAPAAQQAPAALAAGPTGAANAQAPLQQVPALGKTGTPLADLPQSVVIVPRSVVTEQGGTSLSDAVHNVSGINLGGSSSYGFFDRFTIRGLDARIYSDGFPDGDEFNGFPHSMNGVQSIEVLKGPGSALFGSATPGGSINIVHLHRRPRRRAMASPSRLGSWGSWMTSVYATGPTTVPGLTYRVDGLFQHSDGFRDLKSGNIELRPVVSWNHDNHVTTFALDFRHIERTPDSYGILLFQRTRDGGTPLNVPNTFYILDAVCLREPGHRSERPLTNAWWIADYLTVNNRLSLLHRDVGILRNSGGGTIVQVGGQWQRARRQLREQTDHDYDFTYQFEPSWKFRTGSVGHTLADRRTGRVAEHRR